jgi:hypothetical protein
MLKFSEHLNLCLTLISTLQEVGHSAGVMVSFVLEIQWFVQEIVVASV